MPDDVELFGGPAAVDQTGNLTIWAIPGRTINQATPSRALLNGAACFRITYSFTSGGYAVTSPQEKLSDTRLTSPQERQSLGRLTPAIADFMYVDSTIAGSAAVVLAAGGEFQIIERRNVPQTTLSVAAQRVRVLNVVLGPQIPGPTDGTGKFAISQAVAVDSLGATVPLIA